MPQWRLDQGLRDQPQGSHPGLSGLRAGGGWWGLVGAGGDGGWGGKLGLGENCGKLWDSEWGEAASGLQNRNYYWNRDHFAGNMMWKLE